MAMILDRHAELCIMLFIRKFDADDRAIQTTVVMKWMIDIS